MVKIKATDKTVHRNRVTPRALNPARITQQGAKASSKRLSETSKADASRLTAAKNMAGMAVQKQRHGIEPLEGEMRE
jgi:hypothetical protein